MCTLALWCFPSLLSITFYTFSRLPLLFLSFLLINLNASVLFSHFCPGTGHIDYWTVRILTNLHFDSQVCFWINHCTCTHAGLLSSTSGTQPWVLGVRTDAIAYIAKKCTILNTVARYVLQIVTQLWCCKISLHCLKHIYVQLREIYREAPLVG